MVNTQIMQTKGIRTDWIDSRDREHVLAALHEASRRSVQMGRGVITSIIQPIRQFNTINLFASFQQSGLTDCFFWEQPAKQIALIGYGAVASIETKGETRFKDAVLEWRDLLRDAVVGALQEEVEDAYQVPTLFGGFSFDERNARTEVWEEFPGGLLILPQILLRQSDHAATCTINTMITPDTDVEQCAERIIDTIQHLHMTMEYLPLTTDLKRPGSPPYRLSIENLRPAADWMKLIEETVKQIQDGLYKKVVLARGVNVAIKTGIVEHVFDVSTILSRLKQSYPNAYVFALQRGKRYFVGATPEQLGRVQDGQLRTMALAGSAARGATEEEDRALGEELLNNKKNKEEHAIVVEMLCKTLKTVCTVVHADETPHLLKLPNVQHLMTPITGELLPGRSVIEVVDDLHPTPAVSGLPLQSVLQAIRESEALDRGWYAGPIGWIDGLGNGEFAVALRSALIHGNEATLFAGCGIVADSEPESEYAESCLKLNVMLDALSEKS